VIVILQVVPPAPDVGTLNEADHVRPPAVKPVTVEDPAHPAPPHVALLRDVGAVPA
jgi:hypothetical protein